MKIIINIARQRMSRRTYNRIANHRKVQEGKMYWAPIKDGKFEWALVFNLYGCRWIAGLSKEKFCNIKTENEKLAKAEYIIM
jgi:hypothetical protein